jgi:hypothetical protein
VPPPQLPALADERVQGNAAGQVLPDLKTHGRDSTTYRVMSALEFMRRRAASAAEKRRFRAPHSTLARVRSWLKFSRVPSTPVEAAARASSRPDIAFLARLGPQIHRKLSMNILKNLKIGTRLGVAFASVLALMLVIATIGLVGISRVNAGLQTVYEDRTVPLAQLGELTRLIMRNRVLVMDMMANPARTCWPSTWPPP